MPSDAPESPTETAIELGTRVQKRTPLKGAADEGRFLPGAVFSGRYRMISLLGRGGMGEVYRATDLMLGQTVALKFLTELSAGDESARDRFLNEVRTAREITHPNVCRVHDIGVADGQLYISMEYVDGEDLASLLTRIGRLPSSKATDLAAGLCAGLAAAHEKGVLHRDLKPANLMLDGRGNIHIMDFGLANGIEQIQPGEVRQGTWAYMAPEQLAGQSVSIRSDLYALGLVLYEMFTGRRPFNAASGKELLHQRQQGLAARPSAFTADIDARVERVIMACIEPDPQRRPNSALAIAAELPIKSPLAAVLAAGGTPSPELVAASRDTSGLGMGTAVAMAVTVIAGLIVAAVLSARAGWLSGVPLDRTPDELVG